MALIQFSIWKRGSGYKITITYLTFVLQQIWLLWLKDKLYMLKEILSQNFVFIEHYLTELNKLKSFSMVTDFPQQQR